MVLCHGLVLFMAISRAKKEEIVKALKEDISSAKAVVFAKFHKLSVGKISDLRRKFRAVGGKYTVSKKTLIGRAFQDAGKGNLPAMEGEVALITGREDELALFKTASDFAKKEKEAFQILGGFFEGKLIDAQTTKTLGMIPSREALLAQVMSVIQGNTRKFLYLLDQLSKRSQY